MIIKVVLFTIDVPSQRGYYFKRSTVEKFLQSDAKKRIIAERSSTGTLTHQDRIEGNISKALPKEDLLLLNRSITHYTSDFYLKGNDLIAELTILDPNLFEGDTRERILYLMGLIKNKISLSVSGAIEADYNDHTKEGMIIYDIPGIDITKSPDFKNSKVIYD